MFDTVLFTWMGIRCTWKIPWTCFGQECFKRFFTREWVLCMEISMYPFNLFNNDWYCFVCARAVSITWKFPWIFLVWHYHIEIVNTADKFSSLKNSSTFPWLSWSFERYVLLFVQVIVTLDWVSFTTENQKSRRYHAHFFNFKQQVDRKR